MSLPTESSELVMKLFLISLSSWPLLKNTHRTISVIESVEDFFMSHLLWMTVSVLIYFKHWTIFIANTSVGSLRIRKHILDSGTFYRVDSQALPHVLSNWNCWKVQMSPATRVLGTNFALPMKSTQTQNLKGHTWVGHQFSVPFNIFYQGNVILGRLCKHVGYFLQHRWFPNLLEKPFWWMRKESPSCFHVSDP